MAKRQALSGAVNQSELVWIGDLSDNDGTGKTGLVFGDLSCYYAIPGSAPVQVPLVTLADEEAAHDDGGFVEVDGTNMPGLYRLDLPDAVYAAVGYVHVCLTGGADAMQAQLGIQVGLGEEITDLVSTAQLGVLTVGAPPDNPTLFEALAAIYSALASAATATSSYKTTYNTAGTPAFKQAVSTDGTTTTRGKAEAI